VEVVSAASRRMRRRSARRRVCGGEMTVDMVRVLGRHKLKKKNSSDERG
jgi:hypothetical protein